MLNDKEKHRYSRHLLLDKVGIDGQLKLKKARVLIIGAGGLGCPALLYLAAAGVGTIGIVDFDTVDASNLQRQILFEPKNIGMNKAVVAKKKLRAQNPLISFKAYDEKLTNQNALELFSEYDIILDGTDNFSTRYMVSDACVLAKKPLVYGAIHKFEGQVSVFNYQDGPSYRDLFPEPPQADSIPSCSEVGVLGVLPGIIGAQQANEVLKMILGIGTVLSSELMIYSSLEASYTKVKIAKKTELSQFRINSISDFKNFNYNFICEISTPESIITKEGLKELPNNTFVVDVREEWELPKIENKRILQAPLKRLNDFVDQIPRDEPVYVVCQKGGRSRSAIRLLENDYNFENLINVEDGMLG